VDVKDVNTADIKTKLEMVQSELALVKAELQEIKANQLSGDQKAQLSGPNIIKKETVITRGVRTTSQDSGFITPPVEARGFVAKLQVYGITGTFGADEGVRLSISHRLTSGPGITRVFRNIRTRYRSTNHVHTCLWFPGLESNIILDNSVALQEVVGEGGLILMVGLPVHDGYVFSINIQGSFNAGQGVDCDLVVEWFR